MLSQKLKIIALISLSCIIDIAHEFGAFVKSDPRVR